jgi:N-dimethylarginine dimethylaminohydrolase
MNQGDTSSIRVNVPSEFATLRKVVMCLANPMSVFSFLRHGGFDIPAVYQLWHNKWAIIHNHQRVREQQRAFIKVMETDGVEVLFAEAVPDCLTQHYTRDIGFAIDDTFFVANPRRRSRQREIEGLRNLLPCFSRVVRLESGTIEGGDVMVDEQYVIIGLGEETNNEGIDCLRRKFKELRIDREVITLEFAHRGIIHLDTRFNIPSKGIGLIHPKSFKPKSLKWLESHFDLIEATDDETANLEINTFSLSPRKVFMRERSHRLASLLEPRGIEPILLDFSEVTKLPGSFRCTTLPIERERHGAG